MDNINKKLTVSFDYPVLFTHGIFDPNNHTLAEQIQRLEPQKKHRLIIFLDKGLSHAQPQLLNQLSQWMKAHPTLQQACAPLVITGGEGIKNDYRNIMSMVDTLLEYKLCRHSFVIAIGGGAVLDAVGFATSLVHRGLRLIRLPSTTLAQNDAGIGVKTGMNLHGGKNTIGTFAPPFAVINDLNLLNSLPQKHWISGLSEAFKVAIIKDLPFFEWLEQNTTALASRNPKAMAYAIQRCAELHLQHIRENGDAFEQGTARPLDFGHWLAHRIEGLSNYAIPHGHAVAAGISLDSRYAATQKWITSKETQRICSALETCGFQLTHSNYRADDLLQGIEDFREHLGGTLSITFPHGLGKKREESIIDLHQLKHLMVTPTKA